MCCTLTSLLKCLIAIINLAVGVAFLGLGIVGILLKTQKTFVETIIKNWLDRMHDEATKEQIEAFSKFILENSTGISILFILIGFVVACLCFVGFIASCCVCTVLLKIYAVVLAVLLVAQIVAVAVIFSNPAKYKNYILNVMKDLLKKYNSKAGGDGYAVELWDYIMESRNKTCCGVTGASDFQESPMNPDCPAVCCRPATTTTTCTITQATALTPPVPGCSDKISSFAEDNMRVVLIILLVGISVQAVLLTFVVAAIFCKSASPI
ncbi:unnamed protein product [Mesocestoides corti]|nr:unnamed protein product [Mesocestoides corti]